MLEYFYKLELLRCSIMSDHKKNRNKQVLDSFTDTGINSV